MSFVFQEYAAQQEQTKAMVVREEKVNPAYAAITTISDLPMPSTLPRNYKAFCREGFTNDSVFKCCSYIMQNGGAIPPKLYTDKTMKNGTIDSHPLLDKLDAPNNEQTGVDYREGILGFLLLAGNSYQYSIRKGVKAPPDELWSLQPDLVKIVPSRLRGITGYTYDDFSKEQNPIDPANIGRLRFWSPSDPLYGFSPMEVAAIMVDMQTAAKRWNLALLQNFAKPSGAWTSEAVLSPNDYSKTLEKLREIFAGFANAGKTQLLDGNLKWQQTGMAPTDVDWLEGIRYNAGSIANIFNIAPQLIGDTSSSTYDNMDQAKAASYTEAIFPLLDKLYALWNNWLLPMYPDLKGAYLYYDKETVEVVQAIIQAKNSAKIEQATKQFLAGGIDMYTYQEMCSTKPDPNGKGIYRVGTILVTSDKLQDYAEQAMKTPAAPPTSVPEPVDENAPPDMTQQQQQGNEPQNNQPAPSKPPKKSGKAKDDTEEEHTGVMIALFLDKASAKKLAIMDGEPPEDLHITLAFLGDKNEIDLDVDDLSDTLAGYASEAIPLKGNVSGVARFAPSESSDNEVPVVALVNISGLQKWRDALIKQVELAGYDVAKDFEFTPHITLAYIDADASMPVETVPDLDLSFDRLWLAVGDDRYSFPIGDEQYPARKRHLRLYSNKAVNAFNLDSDVKKKAYIKAMQDAREQWVGHGQEQLATYFKAEHKAVSQALNTPGSKKSAIKAAVEGQSAKLKKTLSRLWQDVEEDIGSQVAHSFKDGKKANIPMPAMVTDTEVRYLLQMSGEKVTGIDETTLEDLQNALAEGVANGESIAEIAARIDQLYLEEIIPNRSMTIAQTEVNSASNRAGLLAAQSSGMALNKTWMTTSGHPRPAHADADGQEVALGDSFDVGGEELDHPGDPSGSAGNVVFCKCCLYFTSAATGQEADISEEDYVSEEESKQGKVNWAISMEAAREHKRRKLANRQEYQQFMETALSLREGTTGQRQQPRSQVTVIEEEEYVQSITTLQGLHQKYNPNHDEHGRFGSGGGSDSGGSGGGSNTERIQVLEQSMAAKHPGTMFDFQGSDPAVMEPAMKHLDSLMSQYPQVAKTMPYIGTGEHIPEAMKKVGYSAQMASGNSFAVIAGTRTKDKAYLPLFMNNHFFGDGTLGNSMVGKAAASGWFAEGSKEGGMNYIVAHEFGHAINFYLEQNGKSLKMSDGTSLADACKEFLSSNKSLGESVSRYAEKGGTEEQFAEAFASLRFSSLGKESEYAQNLAAFLDKALPRSTKASHILMDMKHDETPPKPEWIEGPQLPPELIAELTDEESSGNGDYTEHEYAKTLATLTRLRQKYNG